jgi:hypothetical protein
MNCKPGDIAIVVKGRERNLGRIVRVVEAFGDVDYAHEGYGVMFCWSVECLSGLADTPAGPTKCGFIPDLALRVLLRREDEADQPQQVRLELGPYPPVALARGDFLTGWRPEPATVERHPLVGLLGLKRGVDFLPGRAAFTEEGERKVGAAYDNPPALGVAAWFAEANRRAVTAADVYQSVFEDRA